MKKCTKCSETKPLSEYHKHSYKKDGYQNNCKTCRREYLQEYRNKNKEKENNRKEKWAINNPNKIKKSSKKYRDNNKNYFKEYRIKYEAKNKERIVLKNKKYRENNKELINEKYNKRYTNDDLFKFTVSIRARTRQAFKSKSWKKNGNTESLIGCSFQDAIKHLNNNKYGFVYGDSELDIDHIIPLSSAKTIEELSELTKYTNIQLLPSEYNRYVKKVNAFNVEHFEAWLRNSYKKN